jgi:hypothetical protein
VNTVFADTFYWIALTLPREAAYAQAQGVTDDIVTTEEVLGEYLTFFSRAPEYLRRRAGMTVKTILTDSKVGVIPKSHEASRSVSISISPAPIKVTA